MQKFLERQFQLKKHGANLRTELLAGVIGFFTVAYIIVVNSSILSEAGIPKEAAILTTIFISVVGCLLMGFMANVPLIVIPGMGINALFAYTLVGSMGLTWQEALAAVTVSGILFMILAFTPLAEKLNNAIPLVLKQGITVGLGLFLVLLGLEKGQLVKPGKHGLLELGALNDPFVLATLLTLLLTLILVIRKVPGTFLWSLILGTGIGFLFGVNGQIGQMTLSLAPLKEVFFAFDFRGVTNIVFWSGVFTMTMVIVFETVGLTFGQTKQLKREKALPNVLRASSITVFLSGLFGTSPTVSALESGSLFASGAKTGLATVTTGLLFAASLVLMPFLGVIPNSAVAPILIVIGLSMLQEFKEMDLRDTASMLSALLIVVLIPFTYSIADGIAAGFIAYPILSLFTKKTERISIVMYVIAALFLLQFIIQWI
ncbi:NCS2 family permease [Listeria ilorinensis]|uniref:NCS2 family permease n=1 Tax=Listeria ilorinensis TaxID=2867439 RepID=UPI001EF53F3E|nr:NCS2 family permease [Listeria ilorinensis]